MNADETSPTIGRRNLKDLPPIQTTFEKEPARRRSNRTRPNEAFLAQDAPRTRSPLKEIGQAPGLRQRSSKMSLFSLFSKPKVEKLRGYHEPMPLPAKQANEERPHLVVHVASSENVPPRSQTAMSFRSTTSKAVPKLRSTKEASEPARRAGHFEPPPLFQAYPQSTKHATLETSATAVDTALRVAKSRKIGSLQVPMSESTPRGSEEQRGSGESNRTSKTRHLPNGSVARVELPQKVFVLITSGYLLQYAEAGPSDRLPEKVLQLGKDSAAFACDLIPGKHYVLQVSQAVDAQGVMIASSGSILSRLGIRSAAARRMTSSFLMVLPSAEDMDSWMVAIRKEIETLGGKKVRPDMSVRSRTGEHVPTQSTIKEDAGQPPSHRYQIRRDPSRVSIIGSPIEGDLQRFPSPPPMPTQEVPEPVAKDDEEVELVSAVPVSALSESASVRSGRSKIRLSIDNTSLQSTAAPSVQETQLNDLRDSKDSKRVSHTSAAMTAATSRDSSPSGSPPTDSSLTASSEVLREAGTARSMYRSLASYGPSRRKSAQVLSPTKEVQTPPDSAAGPKVQRHSTVTFGAGSQVTGGSSPAPVATVSPRKRFSLMPASIHRSQSRESLATSRPAPPPKTADGERPESFVGDLPPPSTWASNRSPSRRPSQSPVRPANPPVQTLNSQSSPRTSEPFTPRRYSTTPFNLPIKVNPSSGSIQPSPRSSRRGSQLLGESLPPLPPPGIQQSAQAPPSPQPDIPLKSPLRTPSGRLSLFPTPQPAPAQNQPIQRSPSAALSPQSQAQAQMNGRMLRRPISMQVHSDHAPFLSSMRPTGPNGRSFTAPIRSLKPSRSSSNMLSLRENRPLQSTAEDADQPTPLLSRSASPAPSSMRFKSLKSRASLPALDLGIPVVGLGPPAPPPQAPLPQVPSRPSSPMPPAENSSGLGIHVGG